MQAAMQAANNDTKTATQPVAQAEAQTPTACNERQNQAKQQPWQDNAE